MFLKDVFRLIKHSLNRFLAIAAIVFIGVSFMMGLLSSSDVMRKSFEIYNNDTKLHDIQIYSQYGFDDSDIKKLSSLDCVEEIYPSKTRDVYVGFDSNKDDKVVGRVRELDSNIDKFVLTEGNLPKKDDECIFISTDISTENVKVGQRITLSLNSEDIHDTLKNTTYTIVGLGRISDFISKVSYPSLLDNKDLLLYVLVPNNNFISEYYTSLLFTIKGARNYNSYLKEYQNFIDTTMDEIETLKDSQESALKDKIILEAQEKIEDAKKELEKAKLEGQQELDDAKKKIDDGEKEIKDNERLIANSEKEIRDGQQELDEKAAQLNNGIYEAESNSGKPLDELIVFTADNIRTYEDLLSKQKELNDNRELLTSAKAQIDEELKVADYLPKKLTKAALKAAMSVIANKESDLYLKLQQAYEALEFLETYDENLETIDNYLVQVNDGISQIENGYASSGGIYETYNNLLLLKDGKIQIEEGYKTLNDAKRKLEDGKKKLADAKLELEDGIKEYEDGLKEFNKKIQEGYDEIEDGEKELDDLEDAKWTILNRQSHVSSYLYKNSANQMQSIGTILPIIFFLVAALVCSTTMKRLIDEQRGEIGVYCALGYSKGQIIARYLTYVLFATLLSSIIGAVFGAWIFPTIVYSAWQILYVSPEIHLYLPIDKLLISILSFVVLMCGVSYFVIIATLKEKPAQLMRPKAPKNAKKILLENITFIWERLSFTSKITARNIFRYKSRFLMTIIGIAGCTGLLLLGFGIKDSISEIISIQFGEFIKFNNQVNLSNDRHIDEIIKEVNSDPNNEYCIKLANYSSNVIFENEEDDVASIYVVEDDEVDKAFELNDVNSKGILDLNNEGVIVTEKFALNNNLKVNDQIIIESASGKQAKVKITGISKMYFSHYIYILDTLYENIFDEKVEYNQLGVKTTNGVGNLDKLEDKYRDVSSLSDFDSQVNRFNFMIKALDYIIMIVIVVAGALAFVVLINLTNVNISERIREIATLKVLGFKDNEVDAYIFKEILLLTIIGALIGLPLGVIETRLVMSIINMEFVMFPTDVKFMSFVYAYMITMVFTIIVFFLTRKELKKVNMIESLKSVE